MPGDLICPALKPRVYPKAPTITKILTNPRATQSMSLLPKRPGAKPDRIRCKADAPQR
jgi:hypothetical protein